MQIARPINLTQTTERIIQSELKRLIEIIQCCQNSAFEQFKWIKNLNIDIQVLQITLIGYGLAFVLALEKPDPPRRFLHFDTSYNQFLIFHKLADTSRNDFPQQQMEMVWRQIVRYNFNQRSLLSPTLTPFKSIPSIVIIARFQSPQYLFLKSNQFGQRPGEFGNVPFVIKKPERP